MALERQSYPIGDLEYGQIVQFNKPVVVNNGNILQVVIKPVVSTSLYTINDAVGELLEFPTQVQGFAANDLWPYLRLDTVVIIDQDKQNAALDLVLFDRRFTPTADNAAMAVSAADSENMIGFASVSTYSTFAVRSVGQARTVNLTLPLLGSGNFYGQLVTRTAPTYTTVKALTVKLFMTRTS